jgi:hypothetical protein
MIQIYKAEISLNGRDSVVEVINTDYIVPKKCWNLVRSILTNSYSLEYEDEVYIYLHYKELEK